MFALSVRNAIAGPSRIRLPLPSSQSNISALRSLTTLPSTQSPLSRISNTNPTPSIREFSASAPSGDKLKSHSGTKKRFFRTASGLFKRAQAGKRHLNTLFSASRINRLGKTKYTTKTQNTMLKKLLPYA